MEVKRGKDGDDGEADEKKSEDFSSGNEPS